MLTLCRGREEHLRNLLRSLALGSVLPGEVILVVMDEEEVADLPPTPFPVVQFMIPGKELPLAAARNLAAAKASFPHLIFQDVDCIASRDLVRSYSEGLVKQPTGVFQGEVFYLPEMDLPDLRSQTSIERLRDLGIRHPSKKPFLDHGVEVEPNFGELWGLSFALHQDTFTKAGGFDETFVGYGGEETDFAQSLRQVGCTLYRVAGAAAFHQHHSVHIPPFHHFQAIIRNARLFYKKWGRWCMNYWLGQFQKSGLIRWDEGLETLEILREPTVEEIQKSKQPGSVRFS